MSADMLFSGEVTAQSAADWALRTEGLPLIYSSADPQVVAAAQDTYGREESAETFEQFFAEVARIVTSNGISKLLTAGGETSGAVVEGLSLTQLEIGPEIDPGVPALRAGEGLVLALKSGNFGSVDYFEKAARVLDGTAP
jgi:3-dehydrotetronate 4-kinase